MQIEWPELGLPIWQIFNRLGRPSSMSGVAAITNQEIESYQNVRRVRLTDWELSMIDMFDSIACEVLNKQG